MIAREELHYLETSATVWRLVIDILKIGHAQRLPRRSFGRDLELYFVYGMALIAIWQNRPVRATAIARYLEIPRETVRRHLMQLTKFKLLEKDDSTFSAGERSQTTRGIELAVKSIQLAAAKLTYAST
jgi:hypothetical protein